MWYVDKEREYLSTLVYDFLKALRERKVTERKKQAFFNFIDNLDQGTEIQKRRFRMFFYLKENEQLESYSSIGRKENCSCNAIRRSVIRLRAILVNLKDNEREQLINILKKH